MISRGDHLPGAGRVAPASPSASSFGALSLTASRNSRTYSMRPRITQQAAIDLTAHISHPLFPGGCALRRIQMAATVVKRKTFGRETATALCLTLGLSGAAWGQTVNLPLMFEPNQGQGTSAVQF